MNLLKCSLVGFLMIGTSVVHGSTFVGNGGNSANVDLEVTLSDIRKTYRSLDFNIEASCEPSEGQERFSFWSVLDGLTEKEFNYCSDFIAKHSSIFQDLARSDGKISFKWAGGDIEVKGADGKLQKAEAVANPADMSITIDEEKFKKLSPIKRITLLTHEILHLIKIDGKLYGDSEKMGPFKTSGRFFDVVGAATASIAHSSRVLRHHWALKKLSKAYKSYWITTESVNSSIADSEADELLADNHQQGGRLLLRRQFDEWGMYVSYAVLQAGSKYYSAYSLSAKHTSELIEAGVAYRMFPFDKPMSYWGQFHLLLKLGLEKGTHNITVSDGYTKIEDEASGLGYAGIIEGVFPVFFNFWAHFGFGLKKHDYKFDKLDVTVGKKETGLFTLGVSYAIN